MNIIERITQLKSLLELLTQHGLHTTPEFEELTTNLIEDAGIMAKSIAKARRIDQEAQRAARTLAREQDKTNA